MDSLIIMMKDLGHPVDAKGDLVEIALLKKVVQEHGEDLVHKLLNEFKTVRARLNTGKLPYNMAKSCEGLYARNYQQLVRIGLCPQIKG